jgi:Adenylate and Guanylate cyclase catalytic domain
VCGLPEANARHAVVMVVFASSIRQQFNRLVSEMATQLGPDTQDLALRIGLHSGPVTAGVLRGQKSRFQLFGDTVNTASRMESNGEPSKIHISMETAKLLIDAGKEHWTAPRKGLVQAKGKGTIQTYWAEPSSRGSLSEVASTSNNVDDQADKNSSIDWTVDIISNLTKKVMGYRSTHRAVDGPVRPAAEKPITSVIDEFKEALEVPRYVQGTEDRTSVELSELVRKQIHGFVVAVSLTYRGKKLG